MQDDWISGKLCAELQAGNLNRPFGPAFSPGDKHVFHSIPDGPPAKPVEGAPES
jgi:hypothetical protein